MLIFLLSFLLRREKVVHLFLKVLEPTSLESHIEQSYAMEEESSKSVLLQQQPTNFFPRSAAFLRSLLFPCLLGNRKLSSGNFEFLCHKLDVCLSAVCCLHEDKTC